MQRSSNGRRSSTNPVRVSLIDREDKNLIRTDPRKILKSKISFSATDVSHIPRPRMRSSSYDPGNNRRSNLKGKSLVHMPTTPITPLTSTRKHNALGLSTGRRSPSGDRASNLGAKSARKDTRNLADKSYQSYMLNTIDNYIHELQCSSILNTNGSLKPITLKIFVEVSGLLVKLIDPKHSLTLANYVEELPKIAKKLHYPGVITKSLLKTANTAHSWPYVLGWLCWLVQVCQVKDLAYNNFQFDNISFVGTEQQMKDNRNALSFMISMYKAWNDEKLDEETALTNKYLQKIEKQQGVSEDELAAAHAALEAAKEDLQVMEQEYKELETETKSLKDILTSLQEDAAKQANDIKAKEEYTKNLNTGTEQMEVQCKHMQDQSHIQNKQYTKLVSIVKEQPMSKMEKDAILNKCMELQDYMQQFDEHLKDIQKDIYTLDIKIASVNNTLNKIVLAYNKEIFVHFGSDMSIDVEELKIPEREMLDPCIMDKLNEKANLMNKLKDDLKQNLAQLESDVEVNTRELELLHEKMRVLQEENAILINKLQEKKANLVNSVKHEESKLREQIQILQNDIQKCQESTPDLQGIISELEEAKDKLEAVKRRKMFIEQNGKRFFEKLFEMFGQYASGCVLFVCIMSSKSEESYKNVVRYNNGCSMENIQYPPIINDKQLAIKEHPARLLVLDNSSTLIEVTVKAKGNKRTHTMVSSTPNSEQNIEERQRPSSVGESCKSWSQTLREQTRPIVKQSLQNIPLRNQHVKKISSEPRDNKKRPENLKQSKNRNSNVNKHLDEKLAKQILSQKKTKEHSKITAQTNPATVASVCSTESILVVDKEIQCDDIFDRTNDKFSVFNPVRTLGFLMKELQHLVKDEKSSKILSNMQQALLRIPMEPVKSTAMDLEALALRTRLDASTAQLEEMSKRMNTLCESLREERDSLKRDILKQLKLLDEARQKQSELESTISILKEQLHEASKTIQNKDKVISELQQENKKHESSQKLIAELRADLIKQTEVARQRLLEMQYLMLERDKLSVLSSHKDSQLNEFRDVVKEFQNQITEQLMGLREACTIEENSNLHGSVVQGGLACSSPSPTSSERSNVLTSWHDISDVSLSTIEPNPPNKELKQSSSKKDTLLTPMYRAERDITKKKMEDNSESKNRDSAQLEFISLPGGESSNTILLASYKDQGCIDQNETKEQDHPLGSKSKESNHVSSQRSVQKDNRKGSCKKSLTKTRKPLQSDGKRNHNNRTAEESSRFVESNLSSNLISSDIKEQFRNIFEDVRRESRISVSVPSPPRHYPHPDWTDSSLRSISLYSDISRLRNDCDLLQITKRTHLVPDKCNDTIVIGPLCYHVIISRFERIN
ncbi:hypothetical protein KPH14_005660 [Odynerus spinipes]|uniref:Kinetochore protein Ndc80 CH domain-containing protein n=1 Tax=Odynerus spinipes TaxID=1348599 RepID=A0AAD9RBA6_9HYME|nr:hypothetical protein KPH14_005660 [Odynerus spinipes]